MSEPAEFETELAEAFEENGADAETAATAAEKAAAFRAEFDEDLTVEEVIEALADAEYGPFTHRFDYAVGDLAAEIEDCTDSRAYRLGGFGDLAADPEQGT